jgi:hypothetical protein
MFPVGEPRKRGSPRDLWGRDAGASRSLLSLSGSAAPPPGRWRSEDVSRHLGGVNPDRGETVTRRVCGTERGWSGPEDLPSQRDREDRPETDG